VAAASSTDHQFAALLEHYALQREGYVLHLADITRSMGGYLDTSNGTSPTQPSFQLDLASPLKPESEWTAIAECERGEAQALRCYLDAIEFDLPKQVLHILEHQYEQTRITYLYVANLRAATSSYIHIVKKLTGKYGNGKPEETLQPSIFDGHKR
jgi:uncharacterized protein (TIGR02284 family)